MNNVTPQRKESVLKSLALLGLLGVILFIAWVSIQIVAVFPTAMTSLASLADSVYNYDPKADSKIELQPVAETAETGSEINLAWDKTHKTGTYAFTFLCEEGVAVEVRAEVNKFENAECGKSYTLGNVDKATVIVASEKKGQAAFSYTISYFKNNVYTPSAQSSQSILITNSRFTEPGPNVNVVTTTPEVTPETEQETTPVVPTTPKPTAPVYEYTYAIPTSDPKGFTDLKVTYLGIGAQNAAGSFTNSGILKEGTPGVLQFSVQNLGTKTSDTWTFKTKLPGNVSYTSGTQAALKPNERSVLTVTFPAVTDTSLQTFTVDVTTKEDNNSKNDSFTWSTIVVK